MDILKLCSENQAQFFQVCIDTHMNIDWGMALAVSIQPKCNTDIVKLIAKHCENFTDVVNTYITKLSSMYEPLPSSILEGMTLIFSLDEKINLQPLLLRLVKSGAIKMVNHILSSGIDIKSAIVIDSLKYCDMNYDNSDMAAMYDAFIKAGADPYSYEPVREIKYPEPVLFNVPLDEIARVIDNYHFKLEGDDDVYDSVVKMILGGIKKLQELEAKRKDPHVMNMCNSGISMKKCEYPYYLRLLKYYSKSINLRDITPDNFNRFVGMSPAYGKVAYCYTTDRFPYHQQYDAYFDGYMRITYKPTHYVVQTLQSLIDDPYYLRYSWTTTQMQNDEDLSSTHKIEMKDVRKFMIKYTVIREIYNTEAARLKQIEEEKKLAEEKRLQEEKQKQAAISQLAIVRKNPDEKFDVFISHNWGQSPEFSNHKRAIELALLLQKRNLKVWIDEEQLTVDAIGQMAHGIENSNKIVIIITREYIDKVKKENDNCKLEFMYSINKHKKMIAVCFDDSPSQREWDGPVGMTFASKIYAKISLDNIDSLMRLM